MQTPLSKLITLFKLGLRLKLLPRILQFKESSFLKPYIERNTVLRRET